MRIGVVGSGVSGLVAAHVLSKQHVVTILEADERLGGHADTHLVDDAAPSQPPQMVAIDTGFIVHNNRTYPVLTSIFNELGVATQASDMSMSVRCDDTGIEWAGALGLRGIFPRLSTITQRGFLRMLVEIPRFHRMARAVLAADDVVEQASLETLGAFLDRGGFSPLFRTHFMQALVAAVWSTDPDDALDYPAAYLFAFLSHHGMLQVFGSPRWRTVTGGSREYVDKVAAGVVARGGSIRTGAKVTTIEETPLEVVVTDSNGDEHRFDRLVIATHPGAALSMLAAPSAAQRDVLSAITYTPNRATLHTDESVLPRAKAAQGSWNYLRRPQHTGDPVTITYDLTRLMRLGSRRRYLVTLGGSELIDPDQVIATREYEHPLYTPTAVAAQRRQREIDTERVQFAGAWQGWGFHEDGARSGLAAAQRIDPTCGIGAPHVGPEPVVYDVDITHTRRVPFLRTFTHRSRMWLVDLDHPARGFQSRDHLGDPELSIKDNIRAYLAEHDIALGEHGRVLMSATPRSFGWAFNPISVHWCWSEAELGAPIPTAVVVEVHNTYGDRHGYLVRPDAQGRGRVDKAMYVSPFHGTDGWYDVAVPVPRDTLQVAITLHSAGEDPRVDAVFSASMTGSRSEGRGQLSATGLRTSALIRAHGIWLWARRLPIHPRPKPESA